MQRTFLAGLLAATYLFPALGQAQGDLAQLTGADPRVEFVDNAAPTGSWRISGNGMGFIVRDLVSGFAPFVSDPGAPNDRIRFKANGTVGFGTPTPGFPFHFQTGANNSRIAQFSQNQDGSVGGNRHVLLGLENTAAANSANFCGFDFILKTDAAARMAGRVSCQMIIPVDANRSSLIKFTTLDNGLLVEPFRIRGNRVGILQANPSAALHVGNATCNGTTWTDFCSRAGKHNIAELSTEAAREAVMALTPVTYAYNDNPTDPRAGFIAEDVPDLVATPDRQGLSSLDIVAALTKVVQEQQREVTTLRQQLADQQQAFETRLQQLEARLAESAP